MNFNTTFESPAAVSRLVLKTLVAVIVFAVLFSGTSCRESNKPIEAVVADAVGQSTETTPPSANDLAKEVDGEFVGQELEQISSPFTKETVLELNAIVARSLSAIEAFDAARQKKDAIDDEQLATLSEKAKQAKADMDAATERLQKSGEQYNEAIFQAMVRFVDGVDQEIREELEASQDK